ncbi:hypothetical protein, unlikely [Trypanosoma congolense IL3000]|uniref:Uncharacterized protein n=1 Tax=Trypanosoma congolense (strain IL3000) TaxID=1068625 RepID=F9W5S5_TRYCI|nr:hypothetical protein, unlikely [Trypanosoma congolense IL3000]
MNQLTKASTDMQETVRYAEESESTLHQLQLLEYNALLFYKEAKYSAHLSHIVSFNAIRSNESYEENSHDKSNETPKETETNSSEEERLEDEEEEESKDGTWKGGPPWRGFFFLWLFNDKIGKIRTPVCVWIRTGELLCHKRLHFSKKL